MIEEEVRSANLNKVSITINDAFNQENFIEVGETSFGTVVEVNKKALEADIFYINADMKIHYFAGYSNALKDFLPGICSYKTIEMNHSMALDPKSTCGRHPFHYNRKRRDNPVSNDMLEAATLIQNFKKSRDTFVLSTINFDNKLMWSGAGSLKEVIQSGIKKLDNITSFKVKPSKYLIVSPGGYPQDQSLHSSQRGVDLSRGAIKNDGKILLIAECIEGITHNEKAKKYFYKRLSKNLDDVLKDIKKKYVLYTHKAYKSAELLKKVNKIMLFTSLDNKSVNTIHMHKIQNPQEIIDKWIKESNDVINIIDSANKIAIYN
jgi:nickel-dependent lactate racemase